VHTVTCYEAHQLIYPPRLQANLAEPQVVHLVIAGPKPDGPSSSTPPDRGGTQNAPAPRSFPAPAVAPPDRNQPSVASASRSTPPRRPPPPAPESSLGGAGSSVGAPQSARSLSEQIGGSQRVQSMPSPLNAAPSASASQQAGGRSSAPSNHPQPNPSSLGQQGAQQPTSSQGTANPNQDAPSQSEAGPSSAGQSSGTPAGPAAGLSQEALQQLYLQVSIRPELHTSFWGLHPRDDTGVVWYKSATSFWRVPLCGQDWSGIVRVADEVVRGPIPVKIKEAAPDTMCIMRALLFPSNATDACTQGGSMTIL
jgi:hypothetical protein